MANKYIVTVRWVFLDHSSKEQEFTFYGTMNLDSLWQTIQNPDALLATISGIKKV